MLEPFRISNGAVAIKESIVIEAHTKDSGSGTVHIGYGEASPMPGAFYSSETPESTYRALKEDLVPDLLGRPVRSPVDYSKMLNSYRCASTGSTEPFARAGMEGAIWDLTAQRLDASVKSLIAPATKPIIAGVALGIYDTIEELLERVGQYINEGYKRVKIKIQPGWDIEPLRKIRERFGDVPLMVDANQAYTLSEHFRTMQDLDALGLLMIEQPLVHDAYVEMAYLTQELKTPICADESADSLDSLGQILYHRSAKIINIKVQRLGGLWNAREMQDRARGAGLDCWLGTMPELGIASSQSLAIASLPSMVYPTDVEASKRWFVDDIVKPLIEIDANGEIVMPEGGFKVDCDKLDQFTVFKEEFAR